MARIEPLTVETASNEGAQILSAIKDKIGMIPNLYATMAHSPAALSAALAFGDAMGTSTLSPQVKEQLALAIAGANSCDYCASAHTAIGIPASRYGSSFLSVCVSSSASTRSALFTAMIASHSPHSTATRYRSIKRGCNGGDATDTTITTTSTFAATTRS